MKYSCNMLKKAGFLAALAGLYAFHLSWIFSSCRLVFGSKNIHYETFKPSSHFPVHVQPEQLSLQLKELSHSCLV
ncbi:hypothetical protein DFJ58DRAFT_806193 [Suillus subalutaceus]|uniref:uncharacterized protein n=1 Tax=Suillus subalutaceus TaxID=48586 RepID=UPI001B8682A2|nr:uncharacterized protein DFJ58DRAFT_806193 [Suillus subalutaceus]KAG1842522.1 hypothetical protein DFJ58DRAFT_806193 [Suillus subalutaceus]